MLAALADESHDVAAGARRVPLLRTARSDQGFPICVDLLTVDRLTVDRLDMDVVDCGMTDVRIQREIEEATAAAGCTFSAVQGF